MKRYRVLNKFVKVLIYGALLLGVCLMALPFFWMLMTSLKTSAEVIQMPPALVPKHFNWQNYMEALKAAPFRRYFLNSSIVAIGVTIGELITTILASFAFARYEFKGKNILFSILLATMMVPSEVLLIPNFVTLSRLGWMDSYKALILPWCANVFSIFLLKQYFMTIPESLYKSAKIDGCSDLKFLRYIMIPMAKPVLSIIIVFKVISSWNSFLWPLIVTNSKEMRTLPVALSAFTSEVGTDYHLLMAATTMMVLPIIILYVLTHRQILDNVSKAGIKG